MAKSLEFRDQISKSLECNICMSVLDTPKILHCYHWFCKDCIDEMLEFDFNGSAVVTCPLCKEHTYITDEETTNVLPVPYQLTGILDLINHQADLPENCRNDLICDATPECKNKVSLYCTSCNITFCQHCSCSHSDKHNMNNETFLPIQFLTKNERLMVVCNEHSTLAKFVCCKNKLICLYCKNRDHCAHDCDTIHQTAKEVKDFVSSHKRNFENIERIIENTVESLEATKVSIDNSRDILRITLKNEKIRCLSEYLGHLNSEEEKILAKYNAISGDHIQRYPEPVSSEYFQNIDKKNEFQIVMEKEKIARSIYNFTSGKVSIPSMTIDLTQSNFLNKNPLGELKLEMDHSYLSGYAEQTNSSFQSNFALSDESNIASNLVNELEGLLEEVLSETHNYTGTRTLSSPQPKEESSTVVEEISGTGLFNINERLNCQEAENGVNGFDDEPVHISLHVDEENDEEGEYEDLNEDEVHEYDHDGNDYINDRWCCCSCGHCCSHGGGNDDDDNDDDDDDDNGDGDDDGYDGDGDGDDNDNVDELEEEENGQGEGDIIYFS